MGVESFDWSLEVELSEKQAVEPMEESPRETQSARAEENSALKDSFSGSRKMSTETSEENVCQHTFQPRPESSAGARLLRPDHTLTFGQNILDAKTPRINLKKRLDLNTWREELARRDDYNTINLQSNARPNIAGSRTGMVTPIVTKKKMSPKSQKFPISAGQDTLDMWTVRNNLRRRFDLNSWRQPQEKKEEGDVIHTA